MIALGGTVRIPAGRRAEALPAIEAMVRASRAEPGCRFYAMAFDVFDDHLLLIFEVFDDADALAAHRASAHMAAWREARARIGGAWERKMAEYDVSAMRAL